MARTLLIEKKQKKFNFCTAAKLVHTLTIRELAKLIENLIAPWKLSPTEDIL